MSAADPKELYARLDVDPSAPAEEIAAAYRRKARVLHPDVAGTGDAAAFIRVKEAYDVLNDTHRRAAYDRAARAATEAPIVHPFVPEAEPEPEPAIRWPQFSDLPLPVWISLGGLFCLATVMAVVQLRQPMHPAQVPDVGSLGPTVQPIAAPAPPLPPAVPASSQTTHYIRPNGDDALLFRRDAAQDAYVPEGRLPAFTMVQAVRLIPQHGLVEIRLADGSTGFVEASRLTPGDSLAARRAYCAYNAGPPPQNGEVLQRRDAGPERLDISNRGSEPLVVKLRDASGKAAVTVFVAPGDQATVGNLPDGVYRPDFATGELWSRACGSFAAGMRAQRFAGYSTVVNLSPLVIPPDLPVAPQPKDISDAAFAEH